MPMTHQQRIKLAQLLELDRPDWHEAGVHEACRQLAVQPGTPFELQARAIAAAGIAAHLTPDCILWTRGAHLTSAGGNVALVAPPPRLDCPRHGDDVRIRLDSRDGQECALCWSERFTGDATPVQRVGVPGPSVEDMKARAREATK